MAFIRSGDDLVRERGNPPACGSAVHTVKTPFDGRETDRRRHLTRRDAGTARRRAGSSVRRKLKFFTTRVRSCSAEKTRNGPMTGPGLGASRVRSLASRIVTACRLGSLFPNHHVLDATGRSHTCKKTPRRAQEDGSDFTGSHRCARTFAFLGR